MQISAAELHQDGIEAGEEGFYLLRFARNPSTRNAQAFFKAADNYFDAAFKQLLGEPPTEQTKLLRVSIWTDAALYSGMDSLARNAGIEAAIKDLEEALRVTAAQTESKDNFGKWCRQKLIAHHFMARLYAMAGGHETKAEEAFREALNTYGTYWRMGDDGQAYRSCMLHWALWLDSRGNAARRRYYAKKALYSAIRYVRVRHTLRALAVYGWGVRGETWARQWARQWARRFTY